MRATAATKLNKVNCWGLSYDDYELFMENIGLQRRAVRGEKLLLVKY